MARPYVTPEELAEAQEKFQARLDGMSDAELAAFQEEFRKDKIQRDEKGRFVKGAPSPNPRGKQAVEVPPRAYTMTQTAKDLLELFEQPVTVRTGKHTRQEPAIVAIYRRLIKHAVDGDWQAIKKCIELRERYSDFRGESLYRLFEAAQDLRVRYKDAGQEMPEDVRTFVEYVEARVVEGQFSAA